MRKELEKKGKSFLIQVLRLLLRNKPVQDKVDLSAVKKILVIRQDNRIGNLVLTAPLLLALRKSFPRAKLSFLSSSVSAEVFSGSKLIDELLVLEKKRYIRNPFAFISQIFSLRRKGFDLAFDCSDENHLSFGHGMWIYLSRAKYRVGHKREKSDLFLNIEVPPVNHTRHATDMHLDLLRFLMPGVSEELPFLDVKREEEEYIRNYLEKMSIGDEDVLVGINLGGTGEKRWDLENFIELGKGLKEKEKVKVVYIWGPQEKDLVKDFKVSGVLTEIFPLPKLSALLKRCDLFITSDSGIMHLSNAVGTTTLAIFIHSDSQKYGPKGEKHRVITSQDGKVKSGEVLEEALKMIRELSSVKQLQMTDDK
ncbi:MAG: glycosyltransferase family 9 protein [candidate division Zixibacteria bacterium]|nr:glycosyltransferase family 9 protein [candidate division Zixibacteria bacterium]